MSTVKFIRGTQAEIANTAISDGQILFETDQGTLNKIFADLANGTRVQIGGNDITTTTDVVYGTQPAQFIQYNYTADSWNDADTDGYCTYCKIGRVVFFTINAEVRYSSQYDGIYKQVMAQLPTVATLAPHVTNSSPIYDVKTTAENCQAYANLGTTGGMSVGFAEGDVSNEPSTIERVDNGSGTEIAYIVPRCNFYKQTTVDTNLYAKTTAYSQGSPIVGYVMPIYADQVPSPTHYTITGWYICEADE